MSVARLLVVALVCFVACTFAIEGNATVGAGYRPVVIMHGIASGAGSMNTVVGWVKKNMPGVYVKNVEIGIGYISSFTINLNDQVNDFCKQIYNDPTLRNYGSFNLIGYSQGGLIARGYVERCNNIPVHNLITWSTPHGGQFGIPMVNLPWIVQMISTMPYSPVVQAAISFANYWRDPNNLNSYLNGAIYLPDINNERASKNPKYKANLLKLSNLVLLYSEIDDVIKPPQSGWFGNFAPGSTSKVQMLESQSIYKEDWLGLKTLKESGRLKFHVTRCRHEDYPNSPCENYFNSITLPYLKN